MPSLDCPYILHIELWITVIYLLHGGSQKTNVCWSEYAVILQLSLNVQHCLSSLRVFFFFWCDIMILFVFLESTCFFPFFSCTWLEFDVYTVRYASLCPAQLQYNVCVWCVCVCTGTHRWEIPGKNKNKAGFLFMPIWMIVLHLIKSGTYLGVSYITWP